MSARSSALSPGDKAYVDTLARACFGLILLGVAARGTTETDIWGHLAIGLDMLRERRFFWIDPYSFTHDQAWINHEWLWDVGAAAVYRSGGLAGLMALRAALIGIVLWYTDRATRHAPIAIRLLVLGLLTIFCGAQWQSTRPQLATLAFYAITLNGLTAWWLPLLFALWANLHGGWLFGLGAVGCFTLARGSRRQWTLAALCGLATLLNPYGFRLWLALADAVRRGWSDVSEWAPVWSLAEGTAALWLYLALVACGAALARYVTVERWVWIWTAIAMAAGARSRRLVALSAITIAILLLRGWKSHPAVSIRWTPPRRGAAGVVLALAAAVGVAAMAPTATCFPPTPLWMAPETDAVSFLRGQDIRGRAVVHFDFGEYAIFHLRDRLSVSIDNRREMVYSEAVLEDHQRFYRGEDPDYPNRLAADVVWLPAASSGIQGLDTRGWHRRFEGPRTVILLKTDGPLIRGRAPNGSPCFPYP